MTEVLNSTQVPTNSPKKIPVEKKVVFDDENSNTRKGDASTATMAATTETLTHVSDPDSQEKKKPRRVFEDEDKKFGDDDDTEKDEPKSDPPKKKKETTDKPLEKRNQRDTRLSSSSKKEKRKSKEEATKKKSRSSQNDDVKSSKGKEKKKDTETEQQTNTAVKKHRFHPGTVALREIKKYQKKIENVIPRAAFVRLVKRCMRQIEAEKRFKKTAIFALQSAAEFYIVGRLQKTQKAAIHANRITISSKDFNHVEEMVK